MMLFLKPMKAPIQIFILSLIASSANAEFRTWTRADGKTAELDLVSVTDSAGVKTGEFKMRNGKTVSLASNTLSEADAKLLADWKPAAATPSAPETTSVFDEILSGNLKKLSGKSLKSHKEPVTPTKYFIFYYTASWCGPCHKYTPSLVEFYNKNKNANFEIVVITSDTEKDAMEGYAEEAKMPWLFLEMDKVSKFEKAFDHGVSGIPSVITCDLKGNIVSRTESIPELEKLVK
jgi:thiol-disulfide isomerase/thioredoxin